MLVCWWWWFDWSFAKFLAPVVTTASIILCFNKHRLTQFTWKMAIKMERGREGEGEKWFHCTDCAIYQSCLVTTAAGLSRWCALLNRQLATFCAVAANTLILIVWFTSLHQSLVSLALCGLRGCKNWPAPFPGRMSYKATEPGLALSFILACFIVLLFIRAPFYVSLVFRWWNQRQGLCCSDGRFQRCFRCYVFCLLVILVELSVLAKWLARKTLRKPNLGEGITSRKPRPKSVHDFLGLLYCFIVLLCICVVSCTYVIYYPTASAMARYSLFVLKMPLNPKQTNKLWFHWKMPLKEKVMLIFIAPIHKTSLRCSGIAHIVKGYHSFYLHTLCFICKQNEPYLPLPWIKPVCVCVGAYTQESDSDAEETKKKKARIVSESDAEDDEDR